MASQERREFVLYPQDAMAEAQRTVFGISFGTYSVTIAACKDGRTEVLANEFGERSTPALVSYLDGEKLVGHAAKQLLNRHAENTAYCMALFLGGRLEDPQLQEVAQGLPCKVVHKDGAICYRFTSLERENFVPAAAPLTEIFKTLRETAAAFAQGARLQAVIAAPASFSEDQQQAISQCASAAGFQVLRVISEPAAACLAYDIGQSSREQNLYVLVYNLGQWTLSVTVLQVVSGMYHTVASQVSTATSGRLFDASITQQLVGECQRQWKVDVQENKRAMHKLRAAAESAKHTLSSDQLASVHLESLHQGLDFQCNLTRGRMEGMCSTLFRNALEPIAGILEQAGITEDQLDYVVLAGGSCRIPRLQQLLQEQFPSARLLLSLPPPEVVASGAALEAGLLTGRDVGQAPHPQLQCAATDLWIASNECEEPCATLLLAQHTPLPCHRRASLFLQPCPMGVGQVTVEVREGTAKGKLVVKSHVPVTEAGVTVEVSLRWLNDNSVTVTMATPGQNCSTTLSCEDSSQITSEQM